MSGSFADIGRTAFKLGTKNAVNETAKKLFPFYGQLSDAAFEICEANSGEDEFIRHMIHMRNLGYNNYIPQRVNFPKLNSQIIKQMAKSEGFQDDLYAQQQLQNAIREQQIYPVNRK